MRLNRQSMVRTHAAPTSKTMFVVDDHMIGQHIVVVISRLWIHLIMNIDI